MFTNVVNQSIEESIGGARITVTEDSDMSLRTCDSDVYSPFVGEKPHRATIVRPYQREQNYLLLSALEAIYGADLNGRILLTNTLSQGLQLSIVWGDDTDVLRLHIQAPNQKFDMFEHQVHFMQIAVRGLALSRLLGHVAAGGVHQHHHTSAPQKV